MKKSLIAVLSLILGLHCEAGNVGFLPSDCVFMTSAKPEDWKAILSASPVRVRYDYGIGSWCGYRGAFNLEISEFSHESAQFILSTLTDVVFCDAGPEAIKGTFMPPHNLPLVLFYSKSFDLLSQPLAKRLNPQFEKEVQTMGDKLFDAASLKGKPIKAALEITLQASENELAGIKAEMNGEGLQIVILSKSAPFLRSTDDYSPEGVKVRRLLNGKVSEFVINAEGGLKAVDLSK